MKHYLFQCGFCGAILFKANNASTILQDIEIKCPNPNCKKILKRQDITINVEERKHQKKSY